MFGWTENEEVTKKRLDEGMKKHNQIISLFTTGDLVQSGIECGCFSCDGAVENVINAYDVAEIHKYSMINRVYFVDFLRTVLFSQSVDHSWKV